eukprot:PhM_4_TR14368/c0_g1_i1/m.41746
MSCVEKRPREDDSELDLSSSVVPSKPNNSNGNNNIDNIVGGPRVLLNDGNRMPLLGLGTFRSRKENCTKAVAHALTCGYRLVDTAHCYNNETFVAKGIAQSAVPRKDVFITTKIPRGAMVSVEKVSAAFSESLRNLETDYVDLLLLHWPGTENKNESSAVHAKRRTEAWNLLIDLQRQGKARSIGVSNFTVTHLKALIAECGVIPAVNQVEVHPYYPQTELRQYCAANNIHVQGYTSLGRFHEPPAVVFGKREPELDRVARDDVVCAVARTNGVSVSHLLLRWSVQHGVSVVPKSTNNEHIEENYRCICGDGGSKQESLLETLPASAMDALDSLDRNLKYAWNPNNVQ